MSSEAVDETGERVLPACSVDTASPAEISCPQEHRKADSIPLEAQ